MPYAGAWRDKTIDYRTNQEFLSHDFHVAFESSLVLLHSSLMLASMMLRDRLG